VYFVRTKKNKISEFFQKPGGFNHHHWFSNKGHDQRLMRQAKRAGCKTGFKLWQAGWLVGIGLAIAEGLPIPSSHAQGAPTESQPTPEASPAPESPAQGGLTTPRLNLEEHPSDANACRGSGDNPLPVYTTSTLSTATGRTIPANTVIRLTGIFGPKRSTTQIRAPFFGWVNASQLKLRCPDGSPTDPLPGDKPPLPFSQLNVNSPSCRRIRRVPEGVPTVGLIARDSPSLSAPIQKDRYGYKDGVLPGDLVQATELPMKSTIVDNYTWLEIWYLGAEKDLHKGWVTAAPVGVRNNTYVANCEK
jgi:hypothetical protein